MLDSTSTQTSSWVRPIVVLLLVQICFWGLLYLIEERTQPSGFSMPDQLPLYLSDGHGQFDLGQRPILVPYAPEPVYLYPDRSGAPAGLFLIDFEWHLADGPVGFFIGWDGQFAHLTLNGHVLPIGARPFNHTNMSGFSPGLYQLPLEHLVDGVNQLGVVVEPRRNKFISHYAVGSIEDLTVPYRWGQAIASVLPFFSFGASLLVLTLCCFVPWAPEDRLRIATFGVLLVAAMARNLQFLGVELIEQVPWNDIVHFAIVLLLLFSFAAVALAWTGQRWRHMRIVIIGYLAALSVVVVGAPLFVNGEPVFGLEGFFYWGWWVETVVTLGVTAWVYVWLLKFCRTATTTQLIEVAIILFCVTMVCVEHLDHRFQITLPWITELPIKNYFSSVVSFILPLGLITTLVNESIKAKTILKDSNKMLEQTLAAKEEEIRQQARQHAIAQERRRLMLDVHDGLGAILSSILLRTRGNKIEYDAIPSAIEDALAELRMIVDSLDVAGDSLAVCLGAFRSRTESRIVAAGLSLDWVIDSKCLEFECSPSVVLQLYRILQEATTNTIKHANASTIRIALEPEPDRDESYNLGGVCLSIQDDGQGFSVDEAPSQACKGLLSMRERVDRIGAQIKIQSSAIGTEITITLPAHLNTA